MARETSSTTNIPNTFEIHLPKYLLGLCHTLFLTCGEQFVTFTMEGAVEIRWGSFHLKTGKSVNIGITLLISLQLFC